LTKKLSEKDKKDWQKFLNSSEKLDNKDKDISSKNKRIEEKIIDLHGFTLEEANKKISDFIVDCYENNVIKINIITGKGLRSKNLDDPYQSQNLSILKYSVPNFIKNDSNLMSKIIKIDFDSVNSPSKGNFDIFLKKKF
tara:strand:- start:271 stop:687 length:417 start_codon:yes stop_codon:yes gene_type:complete